MTTATITLGAALHAYRSALTQLRTLGLNRSDQDYNFAFKTLLITRDMLESMMPTDQDLAFIRDDAGKVWALEWGNSRRTGAGWPDSSFPTVKPIEELISN